MTRYNYGANILTLKLRAAARRRQFELCCVARLIVRSQEDILDCLVLEIESKRRKVMSNELGQVLEISQKNTEDCKPSQFSLRLQRCQFGSANVVEALKNLTKRIAPLMANERRVPPQKAVVAGGPLDDGDETVSALETISSPVCAELDLLSKKHSEAIVLIDDILNRLEI